MGVMGARVNLAGVVLAGLGYVTLPQLCDAASLSSKSTHSGMISVTELKKWGYRISKRPTYNARFCDPDIEKIVKVQYQSIKSFRAQTTTSALYPRYTLILEHYRNQSQAQRREQQIKRPKFKSSKYSKLCTIRLVKRQGRRLCIIHTDAMIFANKEMHRLENLLYQSKCIKK